MIWPKKYLLIPYTKMNCSEFVEYVLRDHFGRDYKFPQSEGSVFHQSHQIKETVPQYCERTESPVDGDLVLMHGIRRMCHVGLYYEDRGLKYVLHNEKRLANSRLSRLSELLIHGYTVEGFYKWAR